MQLQSGDVIGATIPGIPAVMSGRSAKLAWGFVPAQIDDADIHIEEIQPGDMNRYRGITAGRTSPPGARSSASATARTAPSPCAKPKTARCCRPPASARLGHAAGLCGPAVLDRADARRPHHERADRRHDRPDRATASLLRRIGSPRPRACRWPTVTASPNGWSGWSRSGCPKTPRWAGCRRPAGSRAIAGRRLVTRNRPM